MGWWGRNKDDQASDYGDNGDQDRYDDAERRAAGILRRWGGERGTDEEVVDRFMKRVDDRADELRGDENSGRRRWW